MKIQPGQTLGRLPSRKKVIIDGQLVELYSIGWLAVMVNRSTQSIRKWERSGKLPTPLVTLSGQEDRWYLAVEISTYTEIFQQEKPNRIDGFKKTKFQERCALARVALKKALAAKHPSMFAPLPNYPGMEKAAIQAQLQRKAARQIRRITAVQRKAKQEILRLNQH